MVDLHCWIYIVFRYLLGVYSDLRPSPYLFLRRDSTRGRVGEADVSFCVTLVVNRNNGTIPPLPQTSRALRVELYKVQHPRIAYIVNETIQDRY